MKKCIYCGATFAESDETCPNCEEPTEPILKKKPMRSELIFKSTRRINRSEAKTDE